MAFSACSASLTVARHALEKGGPGDPRGSEMSSSGWCSTRSDEPAAQYGSSLDSPLEGTGFEPLVPRRKKKASSGSSTPRVRFGRQGDKGAKPRSLLREPEHNIPAASYSGIACRQALQDYRHFP